MKAKYKNPVQSSNNHPWQLADKEMEGLIDGIAVREIISYKWDHTVLAVQLKMLNFPPCKLSEGKEMGEVEGNHWTWDIFF